MRVPIENNGQMPIYVGGVMIPPGETRHFEDDMLPPEFRAPAEGQAEPEALDPLLAVLGGTVDHIKLGLPDLGDEELDRLEMLEAEGKARKTLIEAIAEERLRRAEAKVTPPAGGEGGEV